MRTKSVTKCGLCVLVVAGETFKILRGNISEYAVFFTKDHSLSTK